MTAIEFDFQLERDAFTLKASAKLSAPVTGIFGPSGAGKSSLLHCLAGLSNPTSGFIKIGKTTVYDSNSGVCLPPHQRGVGFVFQDTRLFPHLSVMGNLLYGKRSSRSQGGARVEEIVELFELSSLIDRRPMELSGGEQQRVALGRALLSNPQLLLLDEPLAALDRNLRAQILPYLNRLRKSIGVPMLYVSHDISELLQQTKTLLLIENGQTKASGQLLDLVRAGHIAHGDLDNVMELTLDRQDEQAGLSFLRSSSNVEIAASQIDAESDAKLHIGLRPEDIVLALARVNGISTRNQLPGHVKALINEGHRVLALVDVGIDLLVEVTPGAVRDLQLREGREVVCLFKANAVRYLDSAIQ
ncbi:MAG: molybdate transport system ATP-binding protein [Planctomycetota bacterium]|jgi:molybdate transport system ATP-binding protein